MTVIATSSDPVVKKAAAEILREAGVRVLTVLHVDDDHIFYRPSGGGPPWTAFLGLNEDHKVVVAALCEGYPVEPPAVAPAEESS